MANQGGSTLYKSVLAANGYYYTTTEVFETVEFGKKVGKIVGMNDAKTMYLVDYAGWLSTSKVWAKASQVQKM